MVYSSLQETHFGATERHLSYGITSDTNESAPPYHNQISQYSIYLLRRDKRLSWSKRLVTYRDGLPAHRQSLIQVLTWPSIECDFVDPMKHVTTTPLYQPMPCHQPNTWPICKAILFSLPLSRNFGLSSKFCLASLVYKHGLRLEFSWTPV